VGTQEGAAVNTEQREQAMDALFSDFDYIAQRDELDAQTDEYERTRDDERA